MNTKECKEAIVQKLAAEKNTIIPERELQDPDAPKYFNVKYWARENKEVDKHNKEIVRYFRNTANECLSAMIGTDMEGNLKYIDIEMD